jgi:flagellar motor switch protein FliN/FliY
MAEMEEPKDGEQIVPGAPDESAAGAAEAAEEAALEAEMAAMADAVKVAEAAKAAQAAQSAPYTPAASSGVDMDSGIGLLYDIELDATLQFGSKEMILRDVLDLGPGDVVELDRHIAEPVDLVVGDRIVARGEVVVANGNFALRILEVATPQMRLESIRCLF